jgi:CRISPR-associated endoribonuclease Cas6
MSPAQRRSPQSVQQAERSLVWPAETELVGLVLTLSPLKPGSLPLQYPRGLHAWFLDQMRQLDPELSAYLHDGGGNKPFAISPLEGPLVLRGQRYYLSPGEVYTWTIAGFSRQVVQAIAVWIQRLPAAVELRSLSLQIQNWAIAYPATTYEDLWRRPLPRSGHLALSFITPTSFRHRGHHLPLPLPKNVFESYLRRWNLFAQHPVDAAEFLDWVDSNMMIFRHQLVSTKVETIAKKVQPQAGKRGQSAQGTATGATGFTGAVEFGLLSREPAEFVRLFWVLGQLAPYVGTGHRTPYGLGQTRLGWQEAVGAMNTPLALLPQPLPGRSDTQRMEVLAAPVTKPRQQLRKRIKELTQVFKGQRQRQGGTRAEDAAKLWATIVARREMGEDLLAIAEDLGLSYETAKTYLKRAR